MAPLRALLVALLTVALASSPGAAQAQQSLFNVPSGQLTARQGLFAQQQFTATSDEGEANTTVEYGLSRYLEIGLNTFHLPLYRSVRSDSRIDQSVFMLNASGAVEPFEALSLLLGGAGGVGQTRKGSQEPVSQGWFVARYELHHRAAFVAGAYGGTRSAIGTARFPLGGLLGLEVPVVAHHLSLMGDWVIGSADASVAVLGAVVFFGPSVQVSAGLQVPAPGPHQPPGGVLELTYVPAP